MMSPALPNPADAFGRVVVSGKRFNLPLRGVAYGPFAPGRMEACAAPDFALIKALGFNTVRLYELPGDAVLEAARAQGLKLIIGIPWMDHVDFLRSGRQILGKSLVASAAAEYHGIDKAIRSAAERYGREEVVAALLVGNEIEKTLVRWMQPPLVKRFLEHLIDLAHEAAPGCLVSYATYPSTEYLIPANADFVAMNVYLEQQQVFEKYLLRLQNLAGHKPLVITEFGLDVAAHGEARQAETRQWFEQACQRHGAAGSVWFSFTDEWFRGGEEVTAWRFGLVDGERRERVAARLGPLAVEEGQGEGGARQAPMPHSPHLSVIVCTRNGSATLRDCLAALGRQTYPHHEVLVIDDGSTDSVPEIARAFPFVRYHRQEPGGLSVARNYGASLAVGDILAYTDDDCVPDEDWLSQIALAFDDPQWVAAGGPNIPPPPRSRMEALVALAPGGPSHVLLNDEEAEHLPGCNLAIRAVALQQIGGFNPIFRTAGDDVDICWRLRDAGGRLRFCPGAVVLHHRRFTLHAYLRQQRGYGHAEAQLMKVHPQRFGPLGGARWRGLIYGEPGQSLPPEEGNIFHGPYGTGAFQVIYSSGSGFWWWDWLGGVLWVALALVLPVAGGPQGAILSLYLTLAACVMAAWRMNQRGLNAWRDKALLWLLCLLQPIVREWARLLGMIKLGARPSFKPQLPDILPPRKPRKGGKCLGEWAFWSEEGKDRHDWLREFRQGLSERDIPFRDDDGWRWFDIEMHPERWISYSVLSVSEYHGKGRVLTRIRLQRRSRWLLAALVLPAALLLCLGWLFLFRSSPLALSCVALFLVVAWMVFPGDYGTTSGYRRLIAKAAERAGLQAAGQRG